MSTSPSKVFISNKGAHDFSAALKYGSLEFVTHAQINRFSVNHMARAWAKKLADSTSSDYILLTSLTTLNVIGCAIFAKKHGTLNLLLFRNEKYISRRLDLSQLDQLEDFV